MSEPLAHSGGHLLAEHLQTVAVIAGRFARAWDGAGGSEYWATLAGLWHDLGKYRPDLFEEAFSCQCYQ